MLRRHAENENPKAVRHLEGREAAQPRDARLELLALVRKRPFRLILGGDNRARHVDVRTAEQHAQIADAGRQLLRRGKETVAWLTRDLQPLAGRVAPAALRVLEPAEMDTEQRPLCSSRGGREEAVGER